MNEHDYDSRLDASLQDYFAARLSGQLGKAAQRFQHDTERPRLKPRFSAAAWRRRSTMGWAAMAAAAAVLLIVVGGRLVAPPQPEPVVPPTADHIQPPQPEPIEADGQPPAVVEREPVVTPAVAQSTPQHERLLVARSVRTRTIDEGTVVIAGRTPLRKLRRQWFEREEWFDPVRGARVERIVPREEVFFVAMPVN